MTSLSLLVLIVFNFVLVGLLPVFFFRRDGDFNLRWVATGAPFFVAPFALVLGYLEILQPTDDLSVAGAAVLQGCATLLSATSIGLIAMTAASHRVPLALWHQDNDAPVELVTWGPYRHVRHPFYSSFLLAFLAGVLAFPHVLMFGCFAYCFIALSITAGREEQRLEKSEFGEQYRRYIKASGRFFPRLM